MKLGVTGLRNSGKTTIFEALTRNFGDAGNRSQNRIGVVRVPDRRVDALSDIYNPKKTTYAQIEYFLPGAGSQTADKSKDQSVWTAVRDCDALIHVIRNFGGFGVEEQNPQKDFLEFDQELIIADQMVVEKRLERIELDGKRGKKTDAEEFNLLKECLDCLENETPLRKKQHLAGHQALRGFAFLSAKPKLVLFNNSDDDEAPPDTGSLMDAEEFMVIRGKLENELAQMNPDEAESFLTEFNITSLAADRVIERSYALLGLISFFTVGDDEVRAWTIKAGTEALDAAGEIHTDIKKGFIRAEVLAYEDFTAAAGSYPEARKQGTVRLEGKTYPVRDGDIINFRFNV